MIGTLTLKADVQMVFPIPSFMRSLGLASALLLVSCSGARLPASDAADVAIANWPYYGGDAGGSRYSKLSQINKSNVANLRIAWEFHTGDVSDGSANRRKSAFETTPIVANGTMYFTTPFNRVVALDPETGREKWSFDPKIDLHAPYSEGLINRGVALWSDSSPTVNACRLRIFLATIDARLFPSTLQQGNHAPISVLRAISTSLRASSMLAASENTKKRRPRQLPATL